MDIGSGSPNIVQAIIEIPKGSKAKYELEKESGMLRLDRHPDMYRGRRGCRCPEAKKPNNWIRLKTERP